MPIQVALPINDIDSGGWSPAAVACQLDSGCLIPNDSEWATAVCHDRFDVKLAPLLSPCGGSQTLTVRLKSDTSGAQARITLLQGSDEIARRDATLSTQFANYDLNLSAADIDKITDYKDLVVRVETLALCCRPCDPVPAGPLIATFPNGGTISCVKSGNQYNGHSTAPPFDCQFPPWGVGISIHLYEEDSPERCSASLSCYNEDAGGDLQWDGQFDLTVYSCNPFYAIIEITNGVQGGEPQDCCESSQPIQVVVTE